MHLSLEHESQLTDQTMEKLHNAVHKENTIWLNHAKWCSHCLAFGPEWKKLKKQMKDNKTNVIDIESSVIEKLQEKNPALYKRVTKKEGLYFPMIVVFSKKDGKPKSHKKYYTENRTSTELKAFVEKEQKPAEKKTKSKKIKGGSSAQVQNVIDKFFKL
jgi:thiol-disulfide isomerase/thioredoxin